MRASSRPHRELHWPPASTRPESKRVLRRAGAATWSIALLLLISVAGSAHAATLTFGSPLAVPASRDTANDLDYQGTNVALPGSVFHIPHDGADGVLWNVGLPVGEPTAPAGGQVVSVRLEGCAKSGGPAPLTQIHFQSLAPLAGGGAKVELTSQAFDIPICGVGGASGATVSSYDPINLCVAQGDYVAFNEEGGFVGAQNGPPPYPAGVPYMVIGSMAGATMDSFIRNNATGNGAVFSPTDTTNHDGFAANTGEELMLQATLATGRDATPICPGGTKGVPPPGSSRAAHRHVFPSLTIPTPQLDGMNIRGVVQVAIYCHSASSCSGTITLHSKPRHGSHPIWLGAARFVVGAHSTGKARVHLSALARRMVRNTAGGLGVEVTGGPTVGTTAFKASIAVQGA
ncbi:MAG TPA: hypothetical protein VNY27_07555 [Solirubrobacteraceae bacterium]|jgi:hypothetical protein|nr:hypothetical protein [Solirubrobacteraceae bacterium]